MKTDVPTALAELRQWPRWVIWRLEERDGKQTKVPYCPGSPRRMASSTDPETWGTYDEAAAAAERTEAAGVGYVFAPDDEYAGIDLDHCVTEGHISFAARAIIGRLDSYTEYSPSGTGVHVLVRASINGGRKKTNKTPWGGDFESYDRGRFFTVTGRHLASTPETIEARQAQLDEIRAELFPPEAPKVNGTPAFTKPATAPALDDVALEEKIRASNQGRRFGELFDSGAGHKDASAADLGLCNILAFWLGPDPPRIDAWFRRSALMREKWDSKRGDTTYGGYTIARALEDRTEFYGQRKPARAGPEPAEAATTTTKTKGAGKMPAWTPDEDDPADRYAAWLNELWGLEGRNPIVSAERFGKHGDAAIVLVREDGQRIRWTHQSTLQKPAGLQAVLISECGIRPRKLTSHDAMLIAWAVTQLADLRADIDPLEEIALWWLRYVDSRPTRHANPADESAWRTVLDEWQRARAADEARSMGNERQTFIVVDERDGVRYVRREDYAEHVRSMVRGGMSWPTLNSRLAEAGWQQTRVQKKATAADAPYVEARLYVVPADWPEPELVDGLESKVGR